jgi:phage-related protein
MFEAIKNKISEMVAVFVEKLPQIQEAFRPLIESISVLFVGALQLAGKIIDWLWKTALKPLADFILASIVPAFNLAIDILIVVIKVVSEVVDAVLKVLVPALNILWDVFTTVFEAIRSVVEFVWNKILQPVFKAIGHTIRTLIIPVIQNLMVIWGHVFNIIRNVTVSVWNSIKAAIAPVVAWIGNNIMPHINRMKSALIGAFNKIKDTASSIWGGIKEIFKGGINGVIDFVNGFIRKINGMVENVNNVATAIPGVGRIEFSVGEIPHLATGGHVTKPIVAAMGEGGYSEAVLPLDRNTGWAEKVANLINNAGGGDGGKTIVVQLGDEVIFEKFINYTNDRAMTTNKPLLNI